MKTYIFMLFSTVVLASCYVHQDSNAAVATPSAMQAKCNTERLDATVTSTAALQAERSLIYSAEFKRDVHGLSVTTVTGTCASMIEASRMGVVRLTNGLYYEITPNGIVSWQPPLGSAFERVELSDLETPDIPGARFVNAVLIDSRRITDDLVQRYVGLWRSDDESMLVEFTKPRKNAEPVRIKNLLRSNLPILSVSFFPAPDTPAGSLWLVQETDGKDVRLIRIGWSHGSMAKDS